MGKGIEVKFEIKHLGKKNLKVEIKLMERNNIGIFDFLGSSGLRGDKEFKKELTDSFENFDFSSDPEFFNTSLDDNFMAIIKKG